jgi:hypothetical protein
MSLPYHAELSGRHMPVLGLVCKCAATFKRVGLVLPNRPALRLSFAGSSINEDAIAFVCSSKRSLVGWDSMKSGGLLVKELLWHLLTSFWTPKVLRHADHCCFSAQALQLVRASTACSIVDYDDLFHQRLSSLPVLVCIYVLTRMALDDGVVCTSLYRHLVHLTTSNLIRVRAGSSMTPPWGVSRKLGPG